MRSITLNNNVRIPQVGLGVYLTKNGDEVANAVKWALEAGYRHIDTAAAYHNEDGVGRGIAESGVDRKDIFITTKLWNGDMREGIQRQAFEDSLRKLGTDYVDLYLIHWPVAGKYIESWKIMEELYKEGKIRAIGVSNFNIHHLEDLLANTDICPAVNQIERHPQLTQRPLMDFCKKHGIAIEAWSPLGGDGGVMLKNEKIIEIAKKYGRTPAQIILRWDYQQDVIIIPKSIHKERIISNFDILGFELSDDDMAAIDALNCDKRVGPDPETFDF